MMKLSLRYEYGKLRMLTKMETKRILNQISNIALLVLLLILFVSMFVSISRNSGLKIDSKVALAIEDKSFEVKALLDNVVENKLNGVIDFEEVNIENGLEKLRNNEVKVVIHIEEGTTERLNYGEAATLKIYINDTPDIATNFLIQYLESLVEVLNEGQSGAMIYWDIMKAEGFNTDERLDELNKIALKYMSSFLTRGRVFEETEDLDNFYGASIINFYFATSLLIISIISAILFHLDMNDDLKKGKIQRVLNNGFNIWHIYSAKIIAGVIFSSLLVTAFKAIFMALFGIFSFGELLKFVALFIMVNVIIHMMVIILYIAIANDILRDWAFIVSFMITSFISGIILPLNSMGVVFKELSRLNILTIGHNLLLGYSLSIERILVITLHFFVLIGVIGYIHRRRWREFEGFIKY
ncbi:ABC transporter permease [Wukongibacter sp. M2B1]|uniref:ABC transporter permease n=1 Tax=Wukongibacter sp. M2B1 TaxID=3088895 RepID=UPI003D78E455